MESISILVVLLSLSGTTLSLTVDTSQGSVAGFTHDVYGKIVNTYLGIPYAKPPVGNLRFKRPQPAESWEGVLQATSLPSSCYQEPDTLYGPFEGTQMWNPNTPMSEDCLYLNIWAPSDNVGNLPVMVWIYGGGFYGGTTTLEWYDGRYLAAEGGVIVVSMNYRVGVLGFLYTGNGDAPGNMGLVDQQFALEWVSKNINGFGGDPNKITIFGESAGGVSVSFHLLSPLSSDLFTRAIMQSGSALAPWAVDSKQLAKDKAKALATRFKCVSNNPTYDEVYDCINAQNGKNLSSHQWYLNDKSVVNTPVAPTIDDYFLVEYPHETMRKENYKKADILLGCTKDEGYFFLFYELPQYFQLFNNTSNLSKHEFELSVKSLLETESQVVISAATFEYGVPYEYANSISYSEALDDVLGDYAFICPVVEFARSYNTPSNGVYLYRYSHITSANPWPSWTGVMHGYEIDIVFGMASNSSLGYTDEERRLSSRIVKYWTNFAKTGDPNTDGTDTTEFTWNKYTNDNKEYILLHQDEPQMLQGLRERTCAFWREFVPVIEKDCNHHGESSSSRITNPRLTLLFSFVVTIILVV